MGYVGAQHHPWLSQRTSIKLKRINKPLDVSVHQISLLAYSMLSLWNQSLLYWFEARRCSTNSFTQKHQLHISANNSTLKYLTLFWATLPISFQNHNFMLIIKAMFYVFQFHTETQFSVWHVISCQATTLPHIHYIIHYSQFHIVLFTILRFKLTFALCPSLVV